MVVTREIIGKNSLLKLLKQKQYGESNCALSFKDNDKANDEVKSPEYEGTVATVDSE